MAITKEQCRAARAMLLWSQADLATAAGVGLSTIRRLETGELTPHASNLAAIRAAFEAAGIIFIDGDDTVGPGVQLREPEKS